MKGPCNRFVCPRVGRLSTCQKCQTSHLLFGGLPAVLAHFAAPTTAARSPEDYIAGSKLRPATAAKYPTHTDGDPHHKEKRETIAQEEMNNSEF